jgi:formate hydrogenlyase transcriptional activator
VLQDREFERLGGTRTIKINIRLIAATNRDLAARVEEREFRSDLYYRLNVFPIRMPALRERKTDIPLLVRYFVQKFSQRMKKQIESIPTEAMQAMEACDWQGNIRELENFIERSVILTDGPVLRAPLGELTGPSKSPDGTLLALERNHIVRVLRETGGVIAGTYGAAIRLGIKRTTLQSMITRFDISREEWGH